MKNHGSRNRSKAGFLLFVVEMALLVIPVTQSTLLAADVHQISVDSPIHPVSMQYIQNAVRHAEQEHAEALIITMDTPGGLMESMRGITRSILNSEVPVIVYVSPEGARAGSAGVFITLSAHVAAMAPGTNIGAATPVGIGDSPIDSSEGIQTDSEAMREKVTNDAVAQARALAERRGRNADWAEQAVREAAAITANRALELGVIDLIAGSVRELLEEIDGDSVETVSGWVVLNTADADVKVFELSWRQRFLNTLANPNLAYILMLLGVYGLIFELYNPGAVIPGVIGVIALVLAFFALQTLPLNWAGLLLILISFAMFILEIKVTSFGFLTLGGVASLALGSIMLFDGPIPALRVSWTVIIPTVVVTVLFFAFALTMGVRAQKNKVTTGGEGMVGEEGFAFTRLDPQGKVKIGGEYWKAEAENPPIEKDEPVTVVGGSRLLLKVRKK